MTLPYPPSANAYWRAARGRGLVPSAQATAYKAAVARAVANARVRPLAGPVRMHVVVYRPRQTGDLDNALKVLCDALNGAAWLDDEQVVKLLAVRKDDASAPRVELRAMGERHATHEEAVTHRRVRAERAAKARATRNRNRMEKARAKLRLSSGLRLPARREES
ncbi:RusA family crossover junction endodeoxyribonuclease [Myxococcus landrumensis]|uniref:RusA family crossover junction endodeoxyribonuclease n=1 Tax=Myxococcus landrumensis TaxID=2813577 RepID=A0ABX7NFQ7_9BACT|nr:RusA family crossover junction endodeoxyribonuclease [Myxococcus landrumus]